MQMLTCFKNYRPWVVFLCPSVRFLDFVRVTDAERSKAEKLFGTAKEPSELARQIKSQKSQGLIVPTFTNGSDSNAKERIYTEEEKAKMRAAIKNSKSITEMASLEKEWQEGRIPAYILAGSDPMDL